MMDPSVLMKENSKLIAVHEGKYFKRSDGLAVGPGCFTRGLEYATGKTATVIGKFGMHNLFLFLLFFFSLTTFSLNRCNTLKEIVLIVAKPISCFFPFFVEESK